MFKMLIIDDEPATIEGIKSAINWPLMDISICGVATDGIKAIELINELNPDIILCDIRMPKLDGISLIKQIQLNHPDVKVIFISGYSDKEYLKSAISLNVIDYIYKPFELAELVKAVEKAKTACMQKHITRERTLNDDIALNLIQNGWISSSSLKNINIDLDSYLITIIIRFNTNLEISSDIESIRVNQYSSDFCRVLDEIFNKRYVISSVNNGYILHANISRTISLDEKMAKQLSQLFYIPKNYTKYMTVGISNPVKSSVYLRDSYCQARKAVLSAFLVGYGKLIFYKDLSNKRFEPSDDLEDMFFDCIDKNNIASAIDFLKEYIDYMRDCSPEDIPAIKDELLGIAFRLNQKLKKQTHTQREYITNIINLALDIKDIEQYLLRLLEQIQDDINNLDQKGRIIFDVEKFILENYDKDLSIDKIAEHVYLTPTYLCHLYKKTTGRTLNQFILEVKMNKSKKLLTDTTLKISEIAKLLGYRNQNYFTKTFTKYFGVNPSTFRNKQL